jgi:hypothetical protein
MKYVAIQNRPRAGDWEDQPPIGAATTVYETEVSPVKTGLLDASGIPLYRVSDRIKMGFV